MCKLFKGLAHQQPWIMEEEMKAASVIKNVFMSAGNIRKRDNIRAEEFAGEYNRLNLRDNSSGRI